MKLGLDPEAGRSLEFSVLMAYLVIVNTLL